MIIAIILGGLAAYQLYAVTQTQNLLIQSQKNMSSLAMWKTMLISKAKAVGYENEIVLPYGDNATNYQTPPKWVYFNTKNPWGKDIIYCPLAAHKSGVVNNNVKIAGGSYGIETKGNFATIFNGITRNYVISSNQSFSANTTDILAFLISPTPAATPQSPSCADITFDTSDNVYKINNGLVEVITKGDVETFANLSMLAGQSEGTSSSSSSYNTTIEGDSSVTGNTLNANLNYIINSDIYYARIKLPAGTHSLSTINLGDLNSNYDAMKKTLIIEGDVGGTSNIVGSGGTTLNISNYNVVLINVNMSQNLLMNVNNSVIKTFDSKIGNINLYQSDWLVTGDTQLISSNLSPNSVFLKGSKLTVLSDNILTITERSGNDAAIAAATSSIFVDTNSTILVKKAANIDTVALINSEFTLDRAAFKTTASANYQRDILVDESSRLNLFSSALTVSGRSLTSISLSGSANFTGSSLIPLVISQTGIGLYNGARLIMKGYPNIDATVGTSSKRYKYPISDINGSFAGGLPISDTTGRIILYSNDTCAYGNIFGYAHSTNGTGQTTENDYALIGNDTLGIIISKLNASNWTCNKS